MNFLKANKFINLNKINKIIIQNNLYHKRYASSFISSIQAFIPQIQDNIMSSAPIIAFAANIPRILF